MSLIQRTLCLLGNLSELISQTRRSKILEAVDSSWGRYRTEQFPSAKDTLFGDEFQSTLTKRVEKDTALSKALSITKKSNKEEPPSSSRRAEPRKGQFFRGGPPAKYGGRQGRSFFPYHTPQPTTGKGNPTKQDSTRLPRSKVTSLYTTNHVSHGKPNRKSPKTPQEPARRYPNQPRCSTGLGPRPRIGPHSCWWLLSPLRGELAKNIRNIRRPMDPGDRHRKQG